MTIARMTLAFFLVAASWPAGGEPVRASASSRVGARILAAPRVIVVPDVVQERIEASREDRERGYLLVSLNRTPQVAVAAGDRDSERLEPAKDGVLRVRASGGSEMIEILWHAE